MSRRARVVALGRQAAGDDAVGSAVLDELRRRGAARQLDLIEARDAAQLVGLLLAGGRVVLVDAAIASPPGRVIQPTCAQLATSPRPLALHGLGAAAAIELARALAPAELPFDLAIVAITIARPRAHLGLSPEVARAIPLAADRVLACAQGPGTAAGRTSA